MTFFLSFILPRLLGFAPEAWTILKPVLLSSGKTFLADALVAAAPVVETIEKTQLPGADKRDLAINNVLAALATDGKQASASVAAAAVELALQKLRTPTA